ncbi:hypothetical protein [Colwellia sp. MEBiC06753]
MNVVASKASQIAILFSLFLLSISLVSKPASAGQLSATGAVDISYIATNEAYSWLRSWQEQGTGVLRYDKSTDALNLRQGFAELGAELGEITDASITGFAYADGEQKLGITEAFVSFKPISAGWVKRYRVGVFYPHFSTENVGKGWQSPYTYSFSSINSWLAEELRIQGAEAEFIRLGRRYRTNYDISVVGAVYWGNDPLGTLLSWRGWAVHDRQTMLGERVEMANYPTLAQPDFVQPTWVKPFKEIDGRPGYYLGVHYRQRNHHDLRLYWYDNLADPFEVAGDNQYSWRTKFASLAWKYDINKTTTLLTQAMVGSTTMGGNHGVDIDFFSTYLMLSRVSDWGRFSARIERFAVNEQDGNTLDANDSDGQALTLAWRYPVAAYLDLGVEYINIDSYNENRSLWPSWQPRNRQELTQVVARFNF